MVLEFLKNGYHRLPKLVRLLLTVALVMIVFGTVMHYTEPHHFPTIFDGIWWAFVTGATVGYGDYVPHSFKGKMIAIFLILTGGGILAYYISTFSSINLKREQNLKKGRIAYKGKDHLIVIGWNERTKYLIELIQRINQNQMIVLIDNTLQRFPPHIHPVHFIHGDPTEDTILQKANVQKAGSVLITANNEKKESQADNSTIITTLAVRGNNKDVAIIVEILGKNQIENAVRAGANKIIRSNDFMSILFYHELHQVNDASPFETVLQLLQKQQFISKHIPEELEDQTFSEAVNHYLNEHELLLGVVRDKNWNINPPADFKLLKNDILLTIANWNS